jgi:hypothetical protein
MLGTAIYYAHRLFQRATLPIRYARTRWELRRAMRPLDRQIQTARRRHKPVAGLLAARRALVNHGLKKAA